MEENITLGYGGDSLAVIAEGHVTARYCMELREKALKYIDGTRGFSCLHFDLSHCDYMDSTFLGLVVLFGKKLGGMGLDPPLIHGANAACLSLLRTMGLLARVRLSPDPCPAMESTEYIASAGDLSRKLLLETHRELSSLSEENRARFRSLEDFLSSSGN